MAVVAPSFDDEFVRYVNEQADDPRDFYARLRAAHPVYRTPLGYWFVTDYEHSEAIWKDAERWPRRPVFSAAPHPLTAGDGATATFFSQNLLALDGEVHKRMRGLVNKVFTPAGITKLNETIAGTVSHLFDQLEGRRQMEFIEEFGLKLPTMVILDVFALDHGEFDRFVRAADTIIECFASLGAHAPADDLVERADVVLGETAEFIKGVADERRGGSGDDLLSQLVRAQDAEPDQLSDSELASLVLLLVTAGFETTTYSAANGLLTLAKFPDQFDRLRSEPALARSAVEEILRYEPGVMVSATMFAAEDQEIAGAQIKRGDRLLICNHAANHDPAAFAEPLKFDITRKPNRQMSFGRGPHTCVGANLARVELTMFFEALVERMPEVQPVDEPIAWKHSHVIRGPERLQLTW